MVSVAQLAMQTIGALAGVDYKHVYYRGYKEIHEITVNPTKYAAATWAIYEFSPNKNLCWSQEVDISFDLNDVQIEQACDIWHIDLFNSNPQKSNNKRMISPIYANIQ